jgi:hypothetical protein
MHVRAGKQKEIRVAIDGPSGTYDNDPEQARDTKPEKAADIPGLRSPRQRPHFTVRSPAERALTD